MQFREQHKSYSELLKDPRWRDFCIEYLRLFSEPQCWRCGSEENLDVHHLGYQKGRLPWEYAFSEVMALCRECHREVHLEADELWNEVLKLKNHWEIYEARKAITRLVERQLREDQESAPTFLSVVARAPRGTQHASGVPVAHVDDVAKT
jgi:5-methylcytosine-specific restriction endonuclease McrA